jgi:hypothetical protein
MYFHLPSPLHGWREFSGEVGIIVLGVLIALGAEQVMEGIHWRQQVAEAERAMSFELGDSIGQSYERQMLAPCIEGRLDQINLILDAAEKSGRLPPVGPIDSAPYRTWVSGTWETTKQGQTASHFSREELTNLAGVYEFIEQLDAINARELSDWTVLGTIVGPGRPIQPAEVAKLRAAAADARMAHRVTEIAAIRARQVADDARIKYDAGVVREYTSKKPSNFPICKPIPASAPTSYNYAPQGVSIERALKVPLTAWK